MSLAGATANPAPAPIPLRIGGYGGAEGLAAFLTAERIDAVIDATHPFAARMSANAVAACRVARTPLVVFTRPPWTREPGDRWIEVAAMEDAVDALGARPKRCSSPRDGCSSRPSPARRSIAISCGRSTARRRSTSDCKLILARGPFSLAGELALMEDERVEALVTKNSGGRATYAKIEAARMLQIEVVIVRRPTAAEAETMVDLDAVVSWIGAHRRRAP